MSDNVDLNSRLGQMATNLAYATALLANMRNLHGPADPNFLMVKQMAADMHPELIRWFQENDEWLRSWKFDIRQVRAY